MTAVAVACGIVLAVSATLCLVAALRSRTVADRSVAIDVLISVSIAAACVAVVVDHDGLFADVVIALSLVGFIGALAAGRFIDRRGL